MDQAYRAQGVDDTSHCSVIILSLFLNWGIPDIKLELWGGISLTLGTAWPLVHSR